eukprot:m.206570 g.206570  ORF g.206570 m.206570 type:complete len:856 (-) comp15536_c26_seq3:73-2640(-)
MALRCFGARARVVAPPATRLLWSQQQKALLSEWALASQLQSVCRASAASKKWSERSSSASLPAGPAIPSEAPPNTFAHYNHYQFSSRMEPERPSFNTSRFSATRLFSTQASPNPLGSGSKASQDEDKDKVISKKISLESKPLSKVEKTVKTLLQKKIEEQENLNYTLLGSFKEPVVVSPWYQRAWTSTVKLASDMTTSKFWADLWVSIKKELHHYKMGFKLMWVDVRISSRLLGQVVRGHALTRREHEQFVRTASDLMRLVPLIVVIVVPFMEFALPFALKLFPNMLPSTFQDKDARSHAELKVRLEVAQFLQETVEHMAVQSPVSGKASQSVAELAEFFERSRRRGHVHTDEILKFAKLFSDELTLDNLGHETLRALCRLLDLQTIGTSNMLRFRLRMKLRELKADDLAIMEEGVDELTVVELQQACRARGMRALGISEIGLRERLKEWLSLHLQDDVPPSLLLMSRLMYLPEDVPEIEKIRVAINALPDSVKDEARVEVVEVEGGDVDYDTRIRILLNEEQLIKAESIEDKAAVLRDTVPLAATAASVDKAAVLRDTAPMLETKKDEAPITTEELVELAFAILSMSDMKRSEQLALSRLKEEVQEHREDLSKLKAADPQLEVPQVSRRLATRVEGMIARLETKLEEQGKASLRKVDMNGDGFISTEELMRVMKRLRPGVDEQTMKSIASTLDTDQDGVLAMDVINKVLAIVAREGADPKPRDLQNLARLVEKERALEREAKFAAIASAPAGSNGAGAGPGGVVRSAPSSPPTTTTAAASSNTTTAAAAAAPAAATTAAPSDVVSSAPSTDALTATPPPAPKHDADSRTVRVVEVDTTDIPLPPPPGSGPQPRC